MYLEKVKNYINDNLIYDDCKEMINYHLNLYLSFFLKDDYNLNNIELKYEEYHKCTYVYLYFDDFNVVFWFRERHCCSVSFDFIKDNIKIKNSLLPKFGIQYSDDDCLYQFNEITVVKDNVLDIKEIKVEKIDLKNSVIEHFDVELPPLDGENNINIICQIIDNIKLKYKNNLVRNREIIKL